MVKRRATDTGMAVGSHSITLNKIFCFDRETAVVLSGCCLVEVGGDF